MSFAAAAAGDGSGARSEKAGVIRRWLFSGEARSRYLSSAAAAAPKEGDLVRLDGQSITKEEFAQFGGCAGRIRSIEEKTGTFTMEYTAFLRGKTEEGLKLSQLSELSPFDVAVYHSVEAAKKEKRRQQSKASREKRKEKKASNEQWPEQLKALRMTTTPSSDPQHMDSEPT